VKNREIQRNIAQERFLEQVGFLDHAENLGALIVEAEKKQI